MRAVATATLGEELTLPHTRDLHERLSADVERHSVKVSQEPYGLETSRTQIRAESQII